MSKSYDNLYIYETPTDGRVLSKSTIKFNQTKFIREAIKTHFVTEKEDYIEIISNYVLPKYKKGDVLAISEKVIALCQNRVVYKDEINVTRLAKFLSRFVHVTPAGKGIGNPEKMQVVIERAGIIRVIIGAVVAAITRPFGVKGLFYKIVKNESNQIDGFTNTAFEYYKDKGILAPKKPDEVCEYIKEKLGIDSIIVDANDLNIEILGM